MEVVISDGPMFQKYLSLVFRCGQNPRTPKEDNIEIKTSKEKNGQENKYDIWLLG